MRVRSATPADVAALAAIYNQGIEERRATFETSLRSDEDILEWFDGVHPIVAVADDDETVIAFARASEYSARECYRGVFEFAVYTEFAHRRRGAAMLAMRELIAHARAAGAWKLVSRIFVDNEPSRMLVAALGFRDVGVHHRHAKLDGRWRDVVVVEKFLAPIGAEASVPPPPGRAPREQVLVSLRAPDAATRLHALESLRSLIDVYQKADADLLDALADAFFASKTHDPAARAKFVELFRAYASISRDAARALDEALFTRLGRLSVGDDLDAFYEATFVVKQVVGRPTAHRGRLLEWTREAIELPRTTRGRISIGNLTSLLMTLALAGSETDEQKAEVAQLAAHAKERHRVERPGSVRPPSVFPAAPAVTPPIDPPPVEEEPVAVEEPSAVEAQPAVAPVDAPSLPTKKARKKRARSKRN